MSSLASLEHLHIHLGAARRGALASCGRHDGHAAAQPVVACDPWKAPLAVM